MVPLTRARRLVVLVGSCVPPGEPGKEPEGKPATATEAVKEEPAPKAEPKEAEAEPPPAPEPEPAASSSCRRMPAFTRLPLWPTPRGPCMVSIR